MSSRGLRRGKFLTNLEIINSHQFSGLARSLCPDVAVDVLGQPSDETQRLVILAEHPAEVAVFEYVEVVIHPYPQVPGQVF